MQNKNEKKRLFNFHLLNVGKQPKKSSCCGSFELEEIPDESENDKDKQA